MFYIALFLTLLETCIPTVKNHCHHLKIQTFKSNKKKMITLTNITSSQNLAFLAFLVFKLLRYTEFVYEQKRQWKVLRSRQYLSKLKIHRCITTILRIPTTILQILWMWNLQNILLFCNHSWLFNLCNFVFNNVKATFQNCFLK